MLRFVRCALGTLAASAFSFSCADSTTPTQPPTTSPVAPAPPVVATPTPPPAPPPFVVPAHDVAENVYIANADGSGARLLTAGSWPAWSPDGRQILVDRQSSIIAVNLDGSGERKIGDGETPAWSPDGTRIAFATAGGIDIMNADGTGVRLLVPHDFRTDTYAPSDMGVSEPTWSPDGAQIAFGHWGDGDLAQATAFVVDTGGGAPRRLTLSPEGFAEYDPAWSPDGSMIVYLSVGYGIATVDAQGSRPRSLYSNYSTVPAGARVTWSKQTNRIAFRATPVLTGNGDIYVMSGAGIAGGLPTLLVADAYQPAWSPDGTHIAFVSQHRR